MPGTNTTINASQVSSGVVTTTNGQVDTVTINGETDEYEIVAYDGVDWLWVTLDGSTPSVGGQNSYPIPPIVGEAIRVSPSSALGNTPKIVAATATRYIVARSPK